MTERLNNANNTHNDQRNFYRSSAEHVLVKLDYYNWPFVVQHSHRLYEQVYNTHVVHAHTILLWLMADDFLCHGEST